MAGYPTKIEIARALCAAEKSGLSIAGFEVGPRGLIKVFLQPHSDKSSTAFDVWQRDRALRGL